LTTTHGPIGGSVVTLDQQPAKEEAQVFDRSRISHQNYRFERIGLFRCVIPVQNEAMIYGYARVSTDGQSVDAQVRQLRAAGASRVFREVASGAKTDRSQLRRILSQLAPDDVLTVMASM
jgi:hypothetical protein